MAVLYSMKMVCSLHIKVSVPLLSLGDKLPLGVVLPVSPASTSSMSSMKASIQSLSTSNIISSSPLTLIVPCSPDLMACMILTEVTLQAHSTPDLHFYLGGDNVLVSGVGQYVVRMCKCVHAPRCQPQVERLKAVTYLLKGDMSYL